MRAKRVQNKEAVLNYNRSINVLDLIQRSKTDEKKEKRKNYIIAVSAFSALAVTGVIISL
tara:strand:+ start:23049 stop:23228 length:180 start_codon:yes stop_codon:yes gene_type:complete